MDGDGLVAVIITYGKQGFCGGIGIVDDDLITTSAITLDAVGNQECCSYLFGTTAGKLWVGIIKTYRQILFHGGKTNIIDIKVEHQLGLLITGCAIYISIHVGCRIVHINKCIVGTVHAVCIGSDQFYPVLSFLREGIQQVIDTTPCHVTGYYFSVSKIAVHNPLIAGCISDGIIRE